MKRSALAVAVSVLVATPLAYAGSADLGGSGWQAVWDVSLNPYVNITVDSVTSDAVSIRKSAEFIQGPDEFGFFPTIPITFQQTGPSSISRIIIVDETLKNSTGVAWTDFHWDLLDGGDAWFIHDSGWSFATSPMNNQQFTPDNHKFSVYGGVVAAGSVWTPGSGANGGELVINAVSRAQAPYTTFILKETPTPEPASLLLIALGVLLLRRR